jgi:hypothetical protein
LSAPYVHGDDDQLTEDYLLGVLVVGTQLRKEADHAVLGDIVRKFPAARSAP